jgi:TIR domain
MADQTTAVERIEARLFRRREVSGEIAIGTHILQIGSVHGGIVNVAVPGERPQPKARSVPIQLRPRPFPAILDRTEESAAAIRALDNGQSVEVFGQPGIGKTVLLRHVAHTIDSKLFQDGLIYREIRGDPPEDVAQVLWGDFFECDVPFKPTDSQLRSDLQSKQALIILDAVELSRAEVEQVMNVAAACTFLLGSSERHLWGSEAHATHLAGLPAKDAKTLVERELGRPLAADEALAVETITNALKGNPLRLLQEVAMARLDDRSLTSVAQDLPSDASPEKLVASITAPLSNVQRRILSALAIFSGAPVPATTLSELLQVDDAEAILEELEERHLVRTHGYFTQTQRIGATAGVTKAEEAESRNHPRAAKLTPSSPKPIQPAFVSYAREDAEFVLRLAKDLRAGGAGVWIDQLDITPGQRWDRAVEDALAKCLQLVVVLSPAAVESTNVMDEVSLALEDGKTVVPVLHRDCKIPFRLRRLQYVNLSLNYEAGLSLLLETVGVAAPGTTNAPVPLNARRTEAEQEQPATSSPKMPEDDMEVRTQRRYTLAGEVALFLPERTHAIEERKRAVAYFANWIERHQRDVSTILETLPILMCCLRWGVKFAMAAEVIRITKSLEFTLVLNGRWESWTNALCWAAQSAIAAGDKAALGWVHHQDGTKALCKGNLPEARESLEQALQIRLALRDKAGAGVTRHNLNLVASPAIAARKVWTLPAGIAAVACAVIAAIALASKFHLWSPSATPAPTVTSTAQTTPQSATTAPTVASMVATAQQSATPAPTVASMAATAPQSATPPPTVASIAAAAPVSVIPATTAPPTGITTPLSVTPVAPSIIRTAPLKPPPLVRIVRFTGTRTAIVRGESARLSYRLENAERASIDPSIGEIRPIEGDLSVSPTEHTTYTLTAFGRDGATQQQQVMINVRPRQRAEPTREASKKREKSSPTPGPRVRESSAGTRAAAAAPAPRGSLQIGIGGAGARIPIGAGTRAPTATPTPRSKAQIGIGRGFDPRP